LKEGGEEPELAERMVTWAAVGGLLGARICYLLSFPKEFLADPLGTAFGGAGFVFYGGFIGGVVAVWLLLRRVGRPFWKMSDLVAPCLAVGYGVGRIGCQLSGDGDYGSASDLPWAMSYYLGVVPTPKELLVHPTPVYESAMAFAIAFILLKLRRTSGIRGLRLSGGGQIFAVYLILSAVARFGIEYLRIEPRLIYSLTQAQLFSILLMLIGVSLLALRSHRATG
jgi:phosphatidylglycerol:prolipoprotein diacylglycerol transferase